MEALDIQHEIHDSIQRLLEGRNFHGISLSHRDFNSCDLSFLDFSLGNLRYSDFRDSTLCFVNFSYSNLYGVNFQNTDLRGSNFSHSNLHQAYLLDAKIDGYTVLPFSFDEALRRGMILCDDQEVTFR